MAESKSLVKRSRTKTDEGVEEEEGVNGVEEQLLNAGGATEEFNFLVSGFLDSEICRVFVDTSS